MSAIPGSTSLGPFVQRFCKEPTGIITAFSDSLLPLCQSYVPENTFVEVLPFGEVSSRFLSMCGEECLPIAQSGHMEAAIAHACKSLLEESPFFAGRNFPGIHKAIARTLKELQEWGIDEQAMIDLASPAEPRLASKLQSLRAIDREVRAILRDLGRQTHAEHLVGCFDAVLDSEGIAKRLLVFAGSDPHPLRTTWLKWLVTQGFEITVVVDRHAENAAIFQGAKTIVAQLGIEPQEVGQGNRLLNSLFSDGPKPGAPVEIAIVSAADPLAEAEWALRGCLEEESCGIFVRDLESYAPLIESSAKRLGVHIQMSRRAPLLTNAFARLTLSAIQFCASNDVRTISPILRSSYVGLKGTAAASVTSAIKDAHRMRVLQWETLTDWAQKNEETLPWLGQVLEWRKEALGANCALAEWAGRLRMLVHVLPWQENLSEGYAAQRDTRAQSQIQRVLANHASVDRVTDAVGISLGEFARICARLWEDADVSIPPTEAGVLVSADAASLSQVETLFVMGMLEGVFPRRRSEDPILTDEERTKISELREGQIPLLDSHDTAAAERDEFYRVCAAARRRIVFSYPVADDQRDNIPAFYLETIKDVSKADKDRKETEDTEDHPRSELAPPREKCVALADIALRASLDGPRAAPLEIKIETEEARARLIPVEEAGFTPNHLRDVLQCPFNYVSRHRLKLNVNRRPTRWSALRNLPQEAGLPTNPSREGAEAAMIGALDARLDLLYSEVPEWEMQLLRAGGRRLIREWVHREFRARETWPKNEGSVRVGVEFGKPGLLDTMPKGVKLNGYVSAMSQIDRTKVAHIYGSDVTEPNEMTETEKLYLGLHFLALYEQGMEGALEIESMGGKRTLLLLTRAGTRPLPSQVKDGLQVVDLSTADDPVISKRMFFEEVKRSLTEALARIRRGSLDTIAGDHCDWCDYGELCRRSKGFSEEESRFGPDWVFDDV